MRRTSQTGDRRNDRRGRLRAQSSLVGALLGAVVLGAAASPALGVSDDTPAAAVATAQPAWSTSTQAFPPSGAPVAPGDEILYTLSIRHDGGPSGTDLEVVDDLSRLAPFVTFDGFVGAWPTRFSWDENSDGRLVVGIDELGPGEVVSYTYRVLVRADVPPGTVLTNTVRTNCAPTPGGDPCTTRHPVPAYVIWATAEPESEATVQPGAMIRYRLHAWNRFSNSPVVGATAIDDLSAVLEHATLEEPLPEGLERDGDRLIWHLPELPPASGYSTASFSVIVDRGEWSAELASRVEPGQGGYCWSPGGPDLDGTAIPSSALSADAPACSTVHRTPDVDVRISKSAEPGAGRGEPVTSGARPADTISYEVTVENAGAEPAYEIDVIDLLPHGVTVAPETIRVTTLPDPAAAAQWTIDTGAPGELRAQHVGPFEPGQRATVTFAVAVGLLERPDPAEPFPDLVNRACVAYAAEAVAAQPGGVGDAYAPAAGWAHSADVDAEVAGGRCATAATPVTSKTVAPPPIGLPAKIAQTGVDPISGGLVGGALALLGGACLASAALLGRRTSDASDEARQS
ncbi:COG1361 family protein [Agromyces silvae]|uniref:hypothetical protein n=1 Tax=Agromyces silvae TaxID=3388266 RepID=UPI00280BE6D1|nr:hypothetical protein [Agromyces protaetiae]